jgi:hypothetical protein
VGAPPIYMREKRIEEEEDWQAKNVQPLQKKRRSLQRFIFTNKNKMY